MCSLSLWKAYQNIVIMTLNYLNNLSQKYKLNMLDKLGLICA